jgi:predicted ATP-grasp superfamily ATP-dependent carboligase
VSTLELRVVLTDPDYKHTLGILRNLRKQGIAVDFVGRKRSICGWSRYSKESEFLDFDFNTPDVELIVDYLNSQPGTVVIPIGARATSFFVNNKKLFQDSIYLLLPEAETFNHFLSKSTTIQRAQRLGIRTPISINCLSRSDLENGLRQIKGDLVIKSDSELNKFPTIYIKGDSTQQDIDSILRIHKGIFEKFDYNVLVQQRIYGRAEAASFLYLNGVCESFFMHERVREYPNSGGPSSCAVSIFKEDLLRQSMSLLDSINWNGVAMVEFKRDINNNELVLMEVNPKFWGSLDLALASGIDFVSKIIGFAHNRNITQRNQAYLVGQRYQWFLESDFKLLRSNVNNFVGVLRDFFSFRTHSNIYLSDLGPSIFLIIKLIKDGVVAWPIVNSINKIYYRYRRSGIKFAFVRFLSENLGLPFVKYSRLTSDVFVGAKLSILGRILLQIKGVTLFVDLRAEHSPRRNRRDTIHFPIVEFEDCDLEALLRLFDIVEQKLREGGTVYFHCREGVGRAPMVTIAYLCFKGKSLEDSLNLVKSVRPFVSLCSIQNNFLEANFTH